MIMAVVWVLIALLSVAVLLLVVPYQVEMAGGYRQRWDGLASVHWFWGAIKLRYLFRERLLSFYLAGLKLFSVRVQEKGEKKPERMKPEGKKRKKFPFTLPVLFSMARKTVKSLKPRGRLESVFGTGDPAVTGMVYGAAASVLGPFSLSWSLTPDFSRAIFFAHGTLAVRVIPARLMLIFAEGYWASRKQRG
jgi:hypothetical protein